MKTHLLLLLPVLCLSPLAAGQAPVRAERLSRHEGGLPRVELIQRRRDAPDRKRAYTLATYSFQLSTRDEVSLVHNDWDIQVAHTDDGPMVHVNMVTDDRSGIVDLGSVALEEIGKRARGLDYGRQTRLPVVVGHSYLVHTKDSDSELWSRFKVVAVDDVRVVFVGEAFAGRFGRPEEADERRRRRVVVDDPRRELDGAEGSTGEREVRDITDGKRPFVTVRKDHKDHKDHGRSSADSRGETGRADESRASAARARAEAARRAREAELARREQVTRDAKSKAREQAVRDAQRRARAQAARDAQRKARDQAARDAQRRARDQAVRDAQRKARDQAVRDAQRKASERAARDARRRGGA